MPKLRQLNPGDSPLAYLGSEIRRARVAAGLTLAEFGALVPCDASTVSRVESGLLAPDGAFVAACDTAFAGAGGWFGRFWSAHQSWDTSPYPPAFRSFAADEARATALCMFEHSLIPGLLQTEDYARAVLSRHPNVSAGEIDTRVAGRIARQSVLDRDPPPLVWVVLDDAALWRCVGTAEITRAALAHLAELARWPSITAQVLDQPGAHVGLVGSFVIAEISGAAGSVSTDDIADGRVIDDAATVADVSARFRWLQSEALPAAASLALIERTAERWTTTTAPRGARALTPVPTEGTV